MKINLAVPVLNLDNQPIKDAKGDDMMFNKTIGNAVFQSPDKTNPLGSYELAKKIYNSTTEIDLSTSEVETLKEKVKEGFTVGFAGQVLEMISKAQSAESASKKR